MNQTHSMRRLGALLLAAGALAIAAPAAIAGPLSWIHGDHVQGSGNITRQNRELGHFTALATSVGGSVEVRIGNTESVSIETDDNLMPLVETVIENGTLRIRPVKKDMQLEPHTLKIVLQAKSLERITVGGSGTVDADRLHGQKLVFDVGGSGAISVRNLEAQSVSVSLGGSGNLKASGTTEQLQVSIGGSGKVQAGPLAARDVQISIGGSGQATVSAKQSLNVSVAGSGDIAYYGDPQITKSIVGSGSLKRLGSTPQ
jgi:hypothetical protein